MSTFKSVARQAFEEYAARRWRELLSGIPDETLEENEEQETEFEGWLWEEEEEEEEEEW